MIGRPLATLVPAACALTLAVTAACASGAGRTPAADAGTLVFTGSCDGMPTRAAALRCADADARSRVSGYVGQEARSTLALSASSGGGGTERVTIQTAFTAESGEYCERFASVLTERSWGRDGAWGAEVRIGYPRAELDAEARRHQDRAARYVARRRALAAAPPRLTVLQCPDGDRAAARALAGAGFALGGATSAGTRLHVSCSGGTERVRTGGFIVARASVDYRLHLPGIGEFAGRVPEVREAGADASSASRRAFEFAFELLANRILRDLVPEQTGCGGLNNVR